MANAAYAMPPLEFQGNDLFQPGRLYKIEHIDHGTFGPVSFSVPDDTGIMRYDYPDSGVHIGGHHWLFFDAALCRTTLEGKYNRRPFTQKAQSILVCTKIGGHAPGIYGPPFPILFLPGFQVGAGDHPLSAAFPFPAFARPCPTRPRHGFVDSRKVNDWQEAVSLLQRATDADEETNAELVLMKPLTGRFSGLATNAGVTWGRSNDGVTAGSDKFAKLVPAPASADHWRGALKGFIRSAGDPTFSLDKLIPDCGYMEIVEHQGVAHAVQLRNGPEQGSEPDFIPRQTVARTIIRPRGLDLMEWEREVEETVAGWPIDTIVIDASGFPLSSHYAVHGIERGIAVVTSHQVGLEEVLVPTKGRPARLTRTQCAVIRSELAAWLNATSPFGARFRLWEEATATAIGTIHAQAFWGWKGHLLRLRAISMVALMKFTLAACVGEMRHWWTSRNGPAGRSDDPGEPEWYPDVPSEDRLNKERLYMEMIVPPLAPGVISERLEKLANSFEHPEWRRGYGGPKWAEVARAGSRLCLAVEKFQSRPNPDTWRAAFNAANVLVNTAHNGGKCLTKLVSEEALNAIAKAPAAGFVNGFAGALLMDQYESWRTRAAWQEELHYG